MVYTAFCGISLLGLLLRLMTPKNFSPIYKYYLIYLYYLRDEKSLKTRGLRRSNWDLYCDLLGLLLRFIGTFLTVDNFFGKLLYWDFYCD